MRYEIQDLFGIVMFRNNYRYQALELAKDYGGKVYDTQLKIYI